MDSGAAARTHRQAQQLGALLARHHGPLPAGSTRRGRAKCMQLRIGSRTWREVAGRGCCACDVRSSASSHSDSLHELSIVTK